MQNVGRKPGRPKRSQDETLSSPTAKGVRLKRLRNLANLSREEFCSTGEVNLATLVSWEGGRFGGLSNKGAERVISRIAREGVFCTHEWLLHEIGTGPEVKTDYNKANINIETQSNLLPEKARIIEELLLFKKLNSNAIDFIVSDSQMSPIYEIGDYVAGTQRFKNQIQSLVGLTCIIQTVDGKTLIRNLQKGTHSHTFNLVSTNLKTINEASFFCDIELASAAPILWHRRREP